MEPLIVVVLGTLAVGCLAIQHRRHVRAVARARAEMFAPGGVARVEGVVQTRGLEFPIIEGTWHGRRMRAELVPDALGFRTLPTLWLVTQVAGPLDVATDATLFARGTGHELFVPRHSRHLRHRCHGVDPSITVTGGGDSEAVERLAATLAPLFEDQRLKLIDVTPSGLRVVVRVHAADHGTYRVTRAADFSGARVTEETWALVADVWDRLQVPAIRGGAPAHE